MLTLFKNYIKIVVIFHVPVQDFSVAGLSNKINLKKSEKSKKELEILLHAPGNLLFSILLFFILRLNGQRGKYTVLNAKVALEHLTSFMEYSVTVESLPSLLSGFRKVEWITSFQKAN